MNISFANRKKNGKERLLSGHVLEITFFFSRSKIIVTSRRPLPNAWVDPRVEFVALDFLDTVEHIIWRMNDICVDVTHAFFTSYVHTDDFKVLSDKNVPLFRNFLDATDTVCTELQRVSLQTGGKVSLWISFFVVFNC